MYDSTINVFSSPFYLNDTIQDELDNYSYHTSFESSQIDLNYSSNFLMHSSSMNTNDDLSQTNGLTPKKWINQQHLVQQSTKNSLTQNLTANSNLIDQQHPSSNIGDRKIITARRFLPFTSLSERSQSMNQSISCDNLFSSNQQIIRKRNNNNLTIMRHNNMIGEMRSKNVSSNY